ncbi:DNA-binding domain-containing protein [Dyella silvatica]|uniref:HvfC/BufC N-terminal domain-containing protein n=1 Tax=Dyella silvatica TaxID=2992128 RepID=UPI002254BF5D|nr:DNA-binding domain-containing protein [Dyella silvatica]
MKLAELQQSLRNWLTCSSDEASRDLDPPSIAGLTVYQNNYRAQLVGCLQTSYPLLSTWMGAELFREAAITHIDNHPPHAWTLDVYGADFEETLRSMFPDNPDIHELAWIEWSLSESFVAADAEPIASSHLSDVDWDHARIYFTHARPDWRTDHLEARIHMPA